MITVLAGVNGAGKSSIGGSALTAINQTWYNPDALVRSLSQQFPHLSAEQVNVRVWQQGVKRLQHAIATDTDFAFETTLGGSSITNTLLDAIAAGIDVAVWYCGLSSVDQHIERVAARVARGGHDIPTEKIHYRYRHSIKNLRRLTPGLRELAIYDNSLPLDAQGKPQLRRLLQVRDHQILALAPDMPDWAKPVATVCMMHTP